MIPVCLTVFALTAVPPPVAPPPREAGRPEAGPPPLLVFAGEVTAVDGGSITVRGYHTWIRDILPDGTTILWVDGQYHLCARVEQTRKVLALTLAGTGDVLRLPRERQPARRFAACPELAAGGWRPTGVRSQTYRLADVRVGDEVAIDCLPVAGGDECRAIQIDRRPGGRVPPAPGEKPDAPFPWHELMNAQQDFEDFGVPVPDELDPRKQMQRATENRLRAERTAPPPREVKPQPKP